jgi:hypothetical protein
MLDSEIIVLEASFTIQCKSELIGAIKNNILASMKTHMANTISFCFKDRNNPQKATIMLYQTSV